MPASDYVDQQVLAALFRGATFPSPSSVFVALYTVTPNKAGGGTEVVGGGYARVEVAATSDDWSLVGPTWAISNINVVDFGVTTAAWGSLTAFGVHDALVGGELLFFDSFTSPVPVESGRNVVFQLGQLILSGAP